MSMPRCGWERRGGFFPRDLKSLLELFLKDFISPGSRSLSRWAVCARLCRVGLSWSLQMQPNQKTAFFSGLGPVRIQTSGEDFDPRNWIWAALIFKDFRWKDGLHVRRRVKGSHPDLVVPPGRRCDGTVKEAAHGLGGHMMKWLDKGHTNSP